MITADTITDEQIRELSKRAGRVASMKLSCGIDTDAQYIRGLYLVALHEGSRRDLNGQFVDPRSRARCAEILNARRTS